MLQISLLYFSSYVVHAALVPKSTIKNENLNQLKASLAGEHNLPYHKTVLKIFLVVYGLKMHLIQLLNLCTSLEHLEKIFIINFKKILA